MICSSIMHTHSELPEIFKIPSDLSICISNKIRIMSTKQFTKIALLAKIKFMTLLYTIRLTFACIKNGDQHVHWRWFKLGLCGRWLVTSMWQVFNRVWKHRSALSMFWNDPIEMMIVSYCALVFMYYISDDYSLLLPGNVVWLFYYWSL